MIFFFVVFVHYRLIRKLPEPTQPVEYKASVNKIKRNCKQPIPNLNTVATTVSENCQTEAQQKTFDNVVFSDENSSIEKCSNSVVTNKF